MKRFRVLSFSALCLLLACGTETPGSNNTDGSTTDTPSVQPDSQPLPDSTPPPGDAVVVDASTPDTSLDVPQAPDATPPVDVPAETTTALDTSTTPDVAPDAEPDVPSVPDVSTVVDGTPDTAADVGPPDAPSPPDLILPLDVTPPEDLGTPEDGGGLPPIKMGCSDGTREGFMDPMFYPALAACGGAWDVPGIHHEAPDCGREAGNTGNNSAGEGCNVEDLCAEGWHVCLGKTDVKQRHAAGCTGIMKNAPGPGFFLTRTSSTGALNCAPDTLGQPISNDDIFGCGDLGCPMTLGKCAGSTTKCVPFTTCVGCDPGQACVNGVECLESNCFPLQRGSHNYCKGIRKYNESSCECSFLGDLPVNDPKYVEGDFENVQCYPSSGGCGWCKPLNYWNKMLELDMENSWECGPGVPAGDPPPGSLASTSEALTVVKTNPFEQGGVICCLNLVPVGAQ